MELFPGQPLTTGEVRPNITTPLQTSRINALNSKAGSETQPQPIVESGSALQPSGRFLVESGKHLLEFRSSGIFGPNHHEVSDRWLDFGIIVQAEYLQNSPTSGQSSEQLSVSEPHCRADLFNLVPLRCG
jgi:hypothetical protein